MEKIKQIIKLENLLSFFIIICPFLDIASFLYRNKFGTSYSISTFVRPIIPIIVFIILYIKSCDKIKVTVISCIFFIYALIHLCIYKTMLVGCSFGTVVHEAQYLVNYSFMILNLYIYKKVYNNDNFALLKKSIVISLGIYIGLMFLAIITHTSSTTYIEGIGYKGWFESGNSISAILVISTFIILSFVKDIKNNKLKIIIFSILLLVGIYLVLLIGTRVGLIGFIVAILCFICAQIYEKIVSKMTINRNSITILSLVLVVLMIFLISFGSVTIQRRKHLQNMEDTIIDESTGEVSHLTGDLTVIRNKIVNNELENDYMSEAQKQSILDLYDISNKHKIKNTNTRMQQLLYHCMLVKNQKNIILILFGNGYLINTNELVWEMEFPAILLNFGLIGFIIYMIPFVKNVINGGFIIIKKYKRIDTNFIMLFSAVSLSFILSTVSGYTFFNSSSMIIIVVANVLFENKVKKIKG